jgi:hypothetical protein
MSGMHEENISGWMSLSRVEPSIAVSISFRLPRIAYSPGTKARVCIRLLNYHPLRYFSHDNYHLDIREDVAQWQYR